MARPTRPSTPAEVKLVVCLFILALLTGGILLLVFADKIDPSTLRYGKDPRTLGIGAICTGIGLGVLFYVYQWWSSR